MSKRHSSSRGRSNLVSSTIKNVHKYADFDMDEGRTMIPELQQYAVILPTLSQPREDFEIFEPVVHKIIGINEESEILYHVVYEDTVREWLAFDKVLGLAGGNEALELFESGVVSDDSEISSYEIDNPEEVEELDSTQETSEDSDVPTQRRSLRSQPKRNSLKKVVFNYLSDPESTIKTRRVTRGTKRLRGQDGSSDEDEEDHDPGRRSGRAKRNKGSMREVGEDEIEEYEDLTVKKAPRIIHQSEIFEEIKSDDPFALQHAKFCITCEDPKNKEKGHLIHCQGCSFSFHKPCIGHRSSREHLVTKLSNGNFVLQCRHCTGRSQKRDANAPHHNKCSSCRENGKSCEPFRSVVQRKETAQNETPEIDVAPERINGPENILFRCTLCRRGFHFEHLPPRSDQSDRVYPKAILAKLRRGEYGADWLCRECFDYGRYKFGKLLAWRPYQKESQSDSVQPNVHEVNADNQEILTIFENESYFKAKWFPGAWVWAQARGPMLKAFQKNNEYPKWTTEEAISEDCLRIEIMFEVEYTSKIPESERKEQVDRHRFNEVAKAYVKFKGLNYEDAAWVEPPPKEQTERYNDFLMAYESYVKGLYLHIPRNLNSKITNIRTQNFRDLEIKKQPKYLVGGELKDYQYEGMNWLYYKWYSNKNCMLADEMGLGKTIQIIAFLSVLQHEHKVWPFLIVVPHSTVPNWVRELKKWSPSLQVIAYYGSREARELTRQNILFHKESRDLMCHVVVTSYQTPIDDATIFRRVNWAGLVVDEGQRLKSDESLLYKTLSTFTVSQRILLTGTPLQNNMRELFNLLQFMDPTRNDAERLEQDFGEITKENLSKLHDLIKPYFLRRTKKGALKDLPPISEMIISLSLTNLQRKLYKSVLAKDAELIRAIMVKKKDKVAERAKLNNILMQLRKVACHPYVYNPDVEKLDVEDAQVQRNLIDAGAKCKLLELMLPKLQQRGHRVLLFSQFLHMLDVVEDFLNGLGLSFLRLDGSNSTAEKQRLIDAFNEPDSKYFAFLLSTKAGGVGINLATADTVIIMDPDFNPHQDMQAISRAHRLGQKNKVLVFHLMTQDCVEERILQMAKKKLSLDHLIIQRMKGEGEEDEDEVVDVESILQHGAEALIRGTQEDIKYDSEAVDKILERSLTQEIVPETEAESTAEAQFSFARVWANETNDFQAPLSVEDGEAPPLEIWDKMIEEREAEAAREKAAREALYGRGRRRSGKVTNYIVGDSTPVKSRSKGPDDDDDDTDFRGSSSGESDDDDDFLELEAAKDELVVNEEQSKTRSHLIDPSVPERHPLTNGSQIPGSGTYTSAYFQQDSRQSDPYPKFNVTGRDTNDPKYTPCNVCSERHAPGECHYRTIPVETCPLCGVAHYGEGPVCLHLGSETQITLMMNALKKSKEDPILVEKAKAYLRGRKGFLQKQKKEQRLKQERYHRAEQAGIALD